MSSPHRLAVIGAGAAGLMAAIHAALTAPQLEVLLIERTRDGGRKILISGGGRCNVLPSELDPRRFVTDSSPHTLKKMLLAWPLAEQRAFFEQDLGLRLVLEEETGKLFPETNHAKDVRDRLVEYAVALGVAFQTHTKVTALNPHGKGWRLEFESGPAVETHTVILATGGLSIPSTGSDGTGIEIARGLGHEIADPYPALTPLLSGTQPHHALAGLSQPVRLKAGRREYEGSFLFTHRGYSGPVVLDASHHVVRNEETLIVNWTDRSEAEWDAALQEGGRRTLRALLRESMPERLALHLMEEAGLDRTITLAELRRESRQALVQGLTATSLECSDHEGYRKAEVTGGGVKLGEVDPRSLESRRAPGLYLCGEILDAFGPSGGHNFAWAWATGRSAGRAAATRAAAPPPA